MLITFFKPVDNFTYTPTCGLIFVHTTGKTINMGLFTTAEVINSYQQPESRVFYRTNVAALPVGVSISLPLSVR